MLASSCSAINGIAVIGTVSRDAREDALDPTKEVGRLCGVIAVAICEQMGSDLARGGIDRNVKLAPPTFLAAMLLCIPLTFPEEFQAAAVQHEMDRTNMLGDTVLSAREAATSPRERGVVWHLQDNPKQAHQAAGECLDLAKVQVEHAATTPLRRG